MNKLNGENIESKQGMDALFLFATEAILVANGNGDIVRINPSAERLFGYEKDELKGQKIEALIPGRFSAHQQHREKYVENPHPRAMGADIDLYALRKDGTEFPVEISLSPYMVQGQKFVVAFIVDITTRKEEEEKIKTYSDDLEKQVKSRTLILEEAIGELERTRKELKIALNKEKELNELKSRFVSIASHEFRTPLTTMLSSLSLITKYGEQNDSENQMRHVNKIKTSINHLTDILNDFLSVSKLEEGKVENMPETVNLENFLADMLSEMQVMKDENHTLVQVYEGNPLVSIDKKLLRHMVLNLLTNAIKFSPEGGKIEVNAKVTASEIRIAIKDEGIGIAPEAQKNLFERFFRADNAMHIQGTGLGLNIVAKYAELMHGTIELESEENKGTTFIIIIPQAK
ncbi:MAG: sensor signal transduction histidine kinase [Crocinitomicaceae bacterium]|jgi:PAS domain S-box-containing protein|nr:sensor signal transduction histidine kinase [Crocinitomicaceae bacterium]